LLRVRARKGRYEPHHLPPPIVPTVDYTPRKLRNHGERQDNDTYADLAKSKCTAPTGHPTEEGATDRGVHATKQWPRALAYGPAVQSSPRGPGSRTLRVNHLTETVRHIDSRVHSMRISASSDSQNFAARVAQPARGPRVRAPAPAPSARVGGGA
jgi:hypothetical protein